MRLITALQVLQVLTTPLEAFEPVVATKQQRPNRSIETVDALSSKSTDTELRARIHQIKLLNVAGAMEEEEYLHVMRYVRDNAPQRLLVWGAGYDSVTYDELNEGGLTTYLVSWVGRADTRTQNLSYAGYDEKAFRTRVDTVEEFIARPHRADAISLLADRPCCASPRLEHALPRSNALLKSHTLALRTCMAVDTVLIDSPHGGLPERTGRAVPIYTAASDLLACIGRRDYASGANVTVFVHDCNRHSEDTLTAAFLGKPVAQVGPMKLSEFRLAGVGASRLGSLVSRGRNAPPTGGLV